MTSDSDYYRHQAASENYDVDQDHEDHGDTPDDDDDEESETEDGRSCHDDEQPDGDDDAAPSDDASPESDQERGHTDVEHNGSMRVHRDEDTISERSPPSPQAPWGNGFGAWPTFSNQDLAGIGRHLDGNEDKDGE